MVAEGPAVVVDVRTVVGFKKGGHGGQSQFLVRAGYLKIHGSAECRTEQQDSKNAPGIGNAFVHFQ